MQAQASDGITILHLSDIHRTNDEPVTNENILAALRADLGRQQEQEGLPRPDFLVISGDLTQSAQEVEYTDAYDLVDRLREELTVPDFSRVILVPGNHDINWGISTGLFNLGPHGPSGVDPGLVHQQGGLYFWTDEERYAARLEPFAAFYHRIYGKEYDRPRRDQHDVWPFPDLGICFVGLNSCDQVDHLRFQGGIYEEALFAADERLRAVVGPDLARCLKIAVWHHDVNWLGRAEHQDGLDPSILGHLVDAGYDLALCGHTHRANLDEYQHPGFRLPVIAAGSLCAGPRQREESIPRLYNLIEIRGDRARVHTRSRETKDVPWAPYARWGRPPTTFFDVSLGKSLARRQEAEEPGAEETGLRPAVIPDRYYRRLISDFEYLDIAGIDSERAIPLKLNEVYVRLRVLSSEDEEPAEGEDPLEEGRSIDIHTALSHYQQLVIVGDPGSGKSTFLKFIALVLARARVENNPDLAKAHLNMKPPLLLPFFVSLWDLSDYIRDREKPDHDVLVAYLVEHAATYGLVLTPEQLRGMLAAGKLCLLLDGLDEVPTDLGRVHISRLVEDLVAEYPDNRYVLTSRIRGYTGGAILRGKFRRCDIQDFDYEDIKRFSRNWLCALLNVSPAEVENPGTQASREHQDLIRAVVDPRVRQLAVNPLLMTVIAVVHWNRKRLPEQRVELYDECIDVLLGQRKDAETIHLVARWQQIYDRVKDRERRYEMRWTRKRFAEIGLAVLRQEKEEEITKDRVVAVLMKPFMDRCQGDEEEARFEAELFLDHQELRSGLLVSRRSHSYRFVHLTFQEYLAAWGLAGRSDYWPVVREYLLDQKWFETLQLLGGVFAAEHSDDKLCEYLDLLLGEMGDEIASRAHVVALCANIVRDAEGVADLRLETRQAYEEALQSTMGVFEPDARVADKTQLEVLEALGRLGRVAKDQLIAATRSQHRSVRSKALDYLCPHLPDQDLFAMAHIFADKSKEPIKTYIQALLERDEGRAAGLLAAVEEPSTRFAEALADLKLVHLLPSFTAVISCFLAAENRDSAQYYLTEMIRRDETGTSKALSGVRDWSWAATAAITNLGREDLLSDDALFSIVEAAEPWYYSGPHFYELAFERDAGRLAGLTRTSPYIVGYLVESGRPDLVDDETFFVVFEVILFRLSPLREADWMPEHIDSYFLPGRGMGTSGAWVAEAFRRDRDRAMAIVADCGRRGHPVWDVPLIQMMTSESNVCRPDWVEWALKTGDLSLLDRFSDESIVEALLSLPEEVLFWTEHIIYYRDPTVRQRLVRIAQRVLELDPGRQDVREWLEWVT